MTNKEQDNILLKDILERNYFTFFRDELNNDKNLNITFFYHNIYTDYNIIPNFESLEEKNNIEVLKNNFSLFLNWYKYQKFHTNLNIHDDKIFDNFDCFLELLDLIKEKNVIIKSLNLYIDLYKFNDFQKLFNKIQILNKKYNIIFIFNIGMHQIEDFIKSINQDLNYKLNILLIPQTSSSILINNQKLINSLKLNVNSYIEVDSDQWTEEAINDYLIYIKFLLDSLSNLEEIFYTKLPIKLIDQHILDNKDCKKHCDFQQSLNILIQNLSINLCHKFQYEDLIIGYLKPNNESTIFNIEAKNLPNIILNTHLKRSSTPHCENCSFIGICEGFCFVRSYLKCFNPIIPIQESCLLKKIKYTFLFQELSQAENIQKLIENLSISNLYKKYLYDIMLNVKGVINK